MEKKVSPDTKWKIIGPIVLAIISFAIWYYQTQYEQEVRPNNITNIHEAPPTDAEVALEAGTEVIELFQELGEGISENNHIKDSIYEANRKHLWVYQIGEIMTSEEAVVNAFKQLDGLANIKVFKESKKSFVLYKDDGVTEEQTLIDGLEQIQSLVSHATSRVYVIDLMTKCDKKEDIVMIDPVKVKKDETEVECCTCDK